MLKVYLDHNIIVDLEKKLRPDFETLLISGRDSGNIIIPYSTAHIVETDNITGSKRDKFIESRFKYLTKLTNNKYIRFDLVNQQDFLYDEKPENVYGTINEVPIAKEAEDAFLHFLSHDDIKEMRSQMNIRVDELNSIEPPDVIKQIDEYLNNKMKNISPDMPAGFSIRWMIDTVINSFPGDGTSNHHEYITVLFKLFNTFGFNPDKKNARAFRAGFNDSSHAAHASFCDFFVTDDEKCRVKALAAYEYLSIPTVVVKHKEMMDILETGNIKEIG